MDNTINISQTQIVLAFAATCIEATARTLGVSYRDVFLRMKNLGDDRKLPLQDEACVDDNYAPIINNTNHKKKRLI